MIPFIENMEIGAFIKVLNTNFRFFLLLASSYSNDSGI
ncbi:hypothetical protein PNC201_06890 [Pseudoalteromonas sp. NC201]|nr:hypothetical protein PNC201_06890 [Pseudoalteromonas sp. NC201]